MVLQNELSQAFLPGMFHLVFACSRGPAGLEADGGLEALNELNNVHHLDNLVVRRVHNGVVVLLWEMQLDRVLDPRVLFYLFIDAAANWVVLSHQVFVLGQSLVPDEQTQGLLVAQLAVLGVDLLPVMAVQHLKPPQVSLVGQALRLSSDAVCLIGVITFLRNLIVD